MADAIAKFQEMDGREVFSLTGTDEHGQKVERSAQQHGVAPVDYVDKKYEKFENLGSLLHCSHSDFIRTTEERHKRKVEDLWNALVERDMIYLGQYEGWYSVTDESFFAERDLVEGRAPTGAAVEWVQEESYFFRLSRWTQRLAEFYDTSPTFVVPSSRQREMQQLLRGEFGEGLADISVSRTSFSWGIRVPQHPQHVVYVWLDALVNYMSAVDAPVGGVEGGSGAITRRLSLWPPDLHVVGKDILYFHAVLWPALLMAVGLEPPKRIVAHGWWMHDSKKMSKSLGNVVDPVALIDKFGPDAVRYFLLSETTVGRDGDFSEAALVRRINADLADCWGNLVHRVLSLIKKNCGGVLPSPSYHRTVVDEGSFEAGQVEEAQRDEDLLRMAEAILSEAKTLMESENDLHKILNLIMKIPREGNKYIDMEAPWKLVKTDSRRADTVLYVLAEVIRRTAVLLRPFVPLSSASTLDQLGVTHDLRTFSSLSLRVPPGTALAASLVPVFPRCDEKGVIEKKKQQH